MSNQTLPAWAMQAARDIIRVNQWFVIPTDDTLARVIAAHAPDSESLVKFAELVLKLDDRQGLSRDTLWGLQQSAQYALDAHPSHPTPVSDSGH